MTDPRFRINVSQTAKGLHQFDVTIELDSNVFKNVNEIDAADIKIKSIGEKLLEVLKDAEEKFRKDGRKLVTDE
ncbi:hypothetical protein [Nitrososphaeria virus YSH_922147]|uniref:Uncharacterized protein n=1 Tax=Nitrososphaeria virus YSH_922147 TaxID=3071323 RepID=A0A976UAU4_9CAUD|nr:hypothetical protein QKV94_gp68 [Yangshan Harbor Nitrososphaeria virus]UVF62477.1 hypothetical protein [Nitrososphaeria virus YSH_922147]